MSRFDDVIPPGFVRASDLGGELGPEELGLDVAARTYKEYEILEDQSLRHPAHARRMARGAFYVREKRGTVGWVPWVGSTVVWPWEVGAWTQDLDRDQVRADRAGLKEKKEP